MSYDRFGAARSPRLSGLALGLAALGFCLAHGSAAEAGAATVNPVQTTTYQLSPGKNPITFGPKTKIQATSGEGVFDNSSTKWTIVNYGLISTTGLFGLQTTSTTKLTNYGTISGPSLGVALQTGSSITNASGASILGGAEIVGMGTISNSGTITGEVYLSKGKFTNTATGVINSNSISAPFSAQGADVTNSGLISNTGGTALNLGDGGASWGAGSLNNTKPGRINSSSIAVESFLGSKSLTNAGHIEGGTAGVLFTEGGKITNASGGVISSDGFGVVDFGSQPGYASTIVNQAHATIYGASGAVFFTLNTGPTTLTNAGSITSAAAAVIIGGGSVNNQVGGVIAGQNAVVIIAQKASLTNAGQITGGVTLTNGGTITNSKSGVIAGDIFSNGPIISVNNGTWQINNIYAHSYASVGGSISNNGLIEGVPGQASAQSYEISGPTIFRNGSSSATGTINLSNGAIGDVLKLDQPFAAANGHSVLTLDAFLGGPGSQADQLQLTAGSSGQTLIRIHDTNTGLGALNPTGIVLVTGASAASNFALDPKGAGYDKKNKGIDHGLFLYSLQFQSGQELLVGTAAPAAHQLATSLSAGQTILASTDFSPSNDASGGAGLAGFRDGKSLGIDRPMFWTSAVNTLSSDPLQQGRYVGRPGGGVEAAPPALRLSALQSAGGMDTGYDQGLAMLKGGVDLIRHHDGERSFSLGLGTAYVQSDQRFTDGGAAMFYSGVVYGGYAAYRSRSAYLNASFKSAMLNAQYQAPWLANSRPNAGLTATGVEIDGGFSLGLARGWSLQPVASMAASHTSMADLQIDDQLAQFKAGYTGWANAGARLEGAARVGGYLLESRFTARLWDRFGDNTAYLAGLGADSPLIDRISGVSGELAAELRMSAGGNLHAFVQTSARAGMAQTSASALAGLSLSW